MKNILVGMIMLGAAISGTTENGKLSGVVTYTDPYGLANQADAGCEIYIINEGDLRSTPYADIENVAGNFQRNKSQYSLSVYNTIDPVSIKRIQDDFDKVSNFTYKYISGFKHIPAVIKAAANGTGNYSFSLKPGKYFLLLISGNVKCNNAAEFKGNIEYRIVDVKHAGGTFLNVNFEKQEMIWIKLITSPQQNGC